MEIKKCHLAAAIKKNSLLRKLVHSDFNFNESIIVRIRYDETVTIHDSTNRRRAAV